MSATSLTSSTTTTPTTRRITSIVLVVLVVLARRVPPLPFSLLTVSCCSYPTPRIDLLTCLLDSKQARDLINVLKEANQQIDPRLQEMVRYGGGGGGGRGWGGGRGRGGGRGGYGGYNNRETGGNAAPLGRSSRW